MKRLESMIVVMLMFTSTLAGCTTGEDENIVQMEVNTPFEDDWVEGHIQVSITTKMTKSDNIVVWIYNNYHST